MKVRLGGKYVNSMHLEPAIASVLGWKADGRGGLNNSVTLLTVTASAESPLPLALVPRDLFR
jgi:hypothetical protein